MKEFQILYLLTFILWISCKKNDINKDDALKTEIGIDTTKLYQKIGFSYGNENDITEEYEVYVSKKKDTFWNQWKFYNYGILDSTKSTFYTLKVEGKHIDSIFKGVISFFSPADSIPNSKIHSREVHFVYLQNIKDSIVYKEIKSNKNVINFDYKNYENLSFVGFISDIRFFKMDSIPEKLLLNQNEFAIDSEISTNNPFVDLLK